VDERRPEPHAREAQRLSAVRGAVVEVQGVGRPEASERADEDGEHIDLALLMARLDRDDVPRRIVEERVDADRQGLSSGEDRRAVADVALPERARVRCLPAEALSAVARRGACCDPVEAVLGVEPAERRGSDRAALETAIEHEGPEDRLDRVSGCSRRTSSRSLRCSSVSSRPRPLSERILGRSASRPPSLNA
jgi:hypothetical protein